MAAPPGTEGRQQQNKGLVSTFFRRRAHGPGQPQATFAAAIESAAYPGAGGAQPAGGARRQILAGKKAAAARDAAGAAEQPAGPQAQEALLEELAFFRGECGRQAHELEELSMELQSSEAEGEALRQQLHLERFKYELLVDLWAMRVLDNEELGLQTDAAAQAAAHHFPAGR